MGREFALLLPATELPHAVAVANRLRLAIRQMRIDFGGQQFSVTASMGVDVSKKGTDRPGQFVEKADAFLYQAKIEGATGCVIGTMSSSSQKDRLEKRRKERASKP